jgi:hypothetical protein
MEGRPREVSEWVRAGRGLRSRSKKAYHAVIADVAEYAQRWGSWWKSLQPEWRKRGSDNRWEILDHYPDECEWGTLASQGQNGCLSLVASLYFWGMARPVGDGNAGVWSEWDWAVQDVLWMMEGVEMSLPEPKKGRGCGKK